MITYKMKNILIILLCLIPMLNYAQDIPSQEEPYLNIVVGSFSAGGIGDFTGAIGTNGSNGYTTDSLIVGDFIRDSKFDRYKIVAITYTVPNSVATIDVQCLETPCIAPVSGNGAAFSRLSSGLELIPVDGSSTITASQRTVMMNHNFLVLDSILQNTGSAAVDSTRLRQDSILVYFQNGVELGRDTISDIGNLVTVDTTIKHIIHAKDSVPTETRLD